MSSLTPHSLASGSPSQILCNEGHWRGLPPAQPQAGGKGQKQLSQIFSPSTLNHSLQETQSPSWRVYLSNRVAGLISFWVFETELMGIW